ncbi:MAG: hypothetical protein JXK04_06590 [Campylobacterales bacterium]|nr:hypothetical protein [Campylobacterales bacterium]
MPKDLYAHDMSREHYQAILKQLGVSQNEELFEEKKGALIKGLVEFFSRSFQPVDVELGFDRCSIAKHFTDPSRPEAFDRMLHANILVFLEIKNKKEAFHPLPYLLSIPEETRSRVMIGFIERGENMERARQITRQQIDAVFGLDERDIIFFLRGRISVRYFTPPKKFPEGADKRFGGESVEDMEAMYTAYFPKGAWGAIEPILDEVIEDKLNFSLIDNVTFAKTFIPVFRSMIEILLLDIVSVEQRSKIEGFTGYVLRQHFHPILLHTAKNLLECVENRDKNAEQFIKYFSEEVLIDANGNKIQKYAIVDSKQQRWHYNSILSVMMQYKQVKLKIASHKEAIVDAQERVSECEAEITAERNKKYALMDKIAEIEAMITDAETRFLQLKGKTPTKEEEALSLKSDITRLSVRQKELYGQMKSKTGELELINGKMANKTNELSRRQKKLADEKKSLQATFEQTAPIRESYELVSEALSLVLAKR